jgi:hypothetical protein
MKTASSAKTEVSTSTRSFSHPLPKVSDDVGRPRSRGGDDGFHAGKAGCMAGQEEGARREAARATESHKSRRMPRPASSTRSPASRPSSVKRPRSCRNRRRIPAAAVGRGLRAQHLHPEPQRVGLARRHEREAFRRPATGSARWHCALVGDRPEAHAPAARPANRRARGRRVRPPPRCCRADSSRRRRARRVRAPRALAPLP